ncbi:hypothetical protein LTR53_014502, partial [Teratosphaeriaceae sp. CCFEE 6253]
MSAGDDVLLRLTPHAWSENAKGVFHLPHNQPWFQESSPSIAEQPTIGSRESTPAIDVESQSTPYVQIYSEHLALTFSGIWDVVKSEDLPSLGDGICFGTDPHSCHVLLGCRGTKGISAKQYTISVHADTSVWLHDHGSTYGTAVMCNKQNGGRLRKPCQWILAFPMGTEGPYEESVIQAGHVHLRVDLPNHAHPSPAYRHNLIRLYNECQKAARRKDGAAQDFRGLALDSCPSTIAPSCAITPSDQPLYYSTAMLGRGEHGEVSLVIHGRTGVYYAAKTFFDKGNKRQADTREAWRDKIQQEFSMAADRPHDNIVNAFELQENPMTIIMEYFPDGNISDAADSVGVTEYVGAFGQTLCGLQHLHDQGVVHRDLKPENFLVRFRPFFRVAIADFGLANIVQSNRLPSTFCGTLKYAAPEVFPGPSARYNSFADIWSIGVVMLEWRYGIPKNPAVPDAEAVYTAEWHTLLIRTVEDQDHSATAELLQHMVKRQLHERWSARHCLEYGLAGHRLFKRRRYDGLIICVDDTADTGDELFAATHTTIEPSTSDIADLALDAQNSSWSKQATRGNARTVDEPESGRPVQSLVPIIAASDGGGRIMVDRELAGHFGRLRPLAKRTRVCGASKPSSGDNSHLNTREVLSAGGQLYAVVERQRVSMQTSNCGLDASGILMASGVLDSG